MNIAVIGAGISGITAAFLLQDRHRVTLFEKNDYFGGHTHTVLIPEGPDKGVPVDTGFIVLNERTYPHFIRLLERLKVETSPTDMSFSYYCEQTGLHFSSQGFKALFAQRSNIVKPGYWRFVFGMIRCLAMIRKDYRKNKLPNITLKAYLYHKGVHQDVIDRLIIPMAAAIWSASDAQMGQFPIRAFAQFYDNHGLLGVTGHPRWYFVKGGSHTYVKAFLDTFKGKAEKNAPVSGISRDKGEVIVHFEDRAGSFDRLLTSTLL